MTPSRRLIESRGASVVGWHSRAGPVGLSNQSHTISSAATIDFRFCSAANHYPNGVSSIVSEGNCQRCASRFDTDFILPGAPCQFDLNTTSLHFCFENVVAVIAGCEDGCDVAFEHPAVVSSQTVALEKVDVRSDDEFVNAFIRKRRRNQRVGNEESIPQFVDPGDDHRVDRFVALHGCSLLTVFRVANSRLAEEDNFGPAVFAKVTDQPFVIEAVPED